MAAQHAPQQAGESYALPVIRGPRWFGSEPKQFVLRAEIPVTFDEMVAALYGTAGLEDLASAEDMCGSVVAALLVEGFQAFESRAEKLHRDDLAQRIDSPAFLSLCRRRVADLMAKQ
jgi:hypothetical protein